MKQLLKYFLDYPWIQHGLFWGASFLILLFHFSVNRPPGSVDYLYTFLYHIPLSLGLYLQLRVGIPFLLDSKKYMGFLVFIGATVGLMILVHQFTFTFLADTLFPGFYLISFVDYTYLSLYFIIYISLGTLLHLSKAWFKLAETERAVVELQKETFQAELKALKGQIHPHFLFNSLNNLYALSLKQDPLLPQLLLKLSDVLRYMIYEADDPEIPLTQELDHLQNYIDLQKIRLNENHQVLFEIEGDPSGKKIIPLIMFNFIENAFKHGIGSGDSSVSIRIKVSIQANQVRLSVVNPIRDKASNHFTDDPGGIGLINVKKRLQMRYPSRHKLVISQDKGIFSIDLTLNLE